MYPDPINVIFPQLTWYLPVDLIKLIWMFNLIVHIWLSIKISTLDWVSIIRECPTSSLMNEYELRLINDRVLSSISSFEIDSSEFEHGQIQEKMELTRHNVICIWWWTTRSEMGEMNVLLNSSNQNSTVSSSLCLGTTNLGWVNDERYFNELKSNVSQMDGCVLYLILFFFYECPLFRNGNNLDVFTRHRLNIDWLPFDLSWFLFKYRVQLCGPLVNETSSIPFNRVFTVHRQNLLFAQKNILYKSLSIRNTETNRIDPRSIEDQFELRSETKRK